MNVHAFDRQEQPLTGAGHQPFFHCYRAAQVFFWVRPLARCPEIAHARKQSFFYGLALNVSQSGFKSMSSNAIIRQLGSISNARLRYSFAMSKSPSWQK